MSHTSQYVLRPIKLCKYLQWGLYKFAVHENSVLMSNHLSIRMSYKGRLHWDWCDRRFIRALGSSQTWAVLQIIQPSPRVVGKVREDFSPSPAQNSVYTLNSSFESVEQNSTCLNFTVCKLKSMLKSFLDETCTSKIYFLYATWHFRNESINYCLTAGYT